MTGKTGFPAVDIVAAIGEVVKFTKARPGPLIREDLDVYSHGVHLSMYNLPTSADYLRGASLEAIDALHMALIPMASTLFPGVKLSSGKKWVTSGSRWIGGSLMTSNTHGNSFYITPR
jgi:hypothetical protein